MTEMKTLDRPLTDVNEVRLILLEQLDVAPIAHSGFDLNEIVAGLAVVGSRAASKLETRARSNAEVDAELAESLHTLLGPVRQSMPELLNEARFWEWIALGPLCQYGLMRWCGGGAWLLDPLLPIPKQAARFLMNSSNIHSHHRHLVRRLYLFAECSLVGGDYSALPTVFGDLDRAQSVFERKLGLSPRIAYALIHVTSTIGANDSVGVTPHKDVRYWRRKFFKQVNVLVSTVALEFLDTNQMIEFFREILIEVLAEERQ